MLEKILTGALQLALIAIVDGEEGAIRTQLLRHVPRNLGARLGVRAGDRRDDEVCGRALLQLLDEQLLHRRRPARQERREVRAVARMDYDAGGNGRTQYPHGGGQCSPAHGARAAPMVSVELSPSVWWMSTLRMRSCAPAIAIRWILRRSAGSVGVSSSVHCSRLPENCTVK